MDALANTLWWTFDEKFGRMTHTPPNPEDGNVLAVLSGLIERVWLSVPWRVGMAFVIPYMMGMVTDVSTPWDHAWKCALLVLVWPWIYHSFIYAKFVDPLRDLPSPKVFLHTLALLISGTLVIWVGSRHSK